MAVYKALGTYSCLSTFLEPLYNKEKSLDGSFALLNNSIYLFRNNLGLWG